MGRSEIPHLRIIHTRSPSVADYQPGKKTNYVVPFDNAPNDVIFKRIGGISTHDVCDNESNVSIRPRA